jgi:hypothetical protein
MTTITAAQPRHAAAGLRGCNPAPPKVNNGPVHMKLFFNNRLSVLRDSIHRMRQAKTTRRTRYSGFDALLEDVVQGTDARIRLVPGYRKKLQDAIGASLEFTDFVVEHIPRAIEMSRRTFVSDPYVNAFFANIADMQSVFMQSSEIRDFLEEHRNDTPAECCSLLCMHMSEKTVTGMEISGDVVHKDVLQKAVNFSDHRVYSPASSEPATREGLKQCLFTGLVNNALDRIMQLKLENHRLQSERSMLHARLRHLRQKAERAEHDAAPVIEIMNAIEETSKRLKNVEDAMLRISPASPQESLELINTVFQRPDEFIQTREFQLRLNKMGIKIDASSREPCNDITLTEVRIVNELPRVVTLATVPRDELLAGSEASPNKLFS